MLRLLYDLHNFLTVDFASAFVLLKIRFNDSAAGDSITIFVLQPRTPIYTTSPCTCTCAERCCSQIFYSHLGFPVLSRCHPTPGTLFIQTLTRGLFSVLATALRFD